MSYGDFARWFGRVIFELFPYGLILMLTTLSVGFFVYAPFSIRALELSSATGLVTLVFVAYLYYGPREQRDLSLGKDESISGDVDC